MSRKKRDAVPPVDVVASDGTAAAPVVEVSLPPLPPQTVTSNRIIARLVSILSVRSSAQIDAAEALVDIYGKALRTERQPGFDPVELHDLLIELAFDGPTSDKDRVRFMRAAMALEP